MTRELRGVGEGLPGVKRGRPGIERGTSSRRDHASGALPLVIGLRGAPLVAPENTLAGLRAALEYGLDGFQYDLRSCASGDPVLVRDETLSRTTDGAGFVRDRSLSQIFGLDAGAWFSKHFVGESVPVFDEALELARDPDQGLTLHWATLHERELVAPVAERVAALAPGRHAGGVRVVVAAESRELCLRVRDAGLECAYTPRELDADTHEFVRRERVPITGLPPGLLTDAPLLEDWPGELWGLGLDLPADLLSACRRPLSGIATAEPQRALAVRELVRLAPEDGAPYPLRVPALHVADGAPVTARERDDAGRATESGRGGEWRGRWRAECSLRNPFPFDVRVACHLLVRRGAFDVDGLPLLLSLAPGESAAVPFELAGGSWSPGGDPLLAAMFEWGRGPGRAAGRLLLDAPLARVRSLVADVVARRVRMLRESPGQPEATMTVRRRGPELLVQIENPGGLSDPHVLVNVDGAVRRGGRGLRVPLPARFDQGPEGIAFCCGFEGRPAADGGARTVLRRWAGGLPDAPDAGAPGRLVPLRAG